MATFDQRSRPKPHFFVNDNTRPAPRGLTSLGIAAANAAGIRRWRPETSPGTGSTSTTTAVPLAGQIGDVYRKPCSRCGCRCGAGSRRCRMFATFRSSRADHDANQMRAREALGIPLDRRVVLTSFGGYGLEGLIDVLRRAPGYHVLLPGMIDEKAMYDRGYRYEDLVRAADVVVTSRDTGSFPNASPTTPRSSTPRAAISVITRCSSMRCPSIFRSAFIDHADLFGGHWRLHLDWCSRSQKPAG